MTAPAWDTISTEITCPLCEYNLRGLTESRCPECGHRFEWQQILEAATSDSPTLFEHGNVELSRRFRQTFFASMFPFSFWRSIRPTMRVSIRRLVWYWVILLVPVAAVILAYLLPDLIDEYKQYYAFSFMPPKWTTGRLITFWLTHRSWEREGITMLIISWPWITLASYRMFWITIRRAKIQWRHLVRVTVYTSDIVVPVLFVIFTLMYFNVQTLGGNGEISSWLGANIGIGDAALFFNAVCLQCILTIRLLIASKRYLALPNGIALALLTQVVFLLVLTIAAGRM